ncbi:MAG: response regulator transcription factor [Gallionellaceae bacterium]|jgi:two-component system response regulator QseB/two-component system response regulator TctD|nr:response regulator transcription factor [Gallionellaceae bacterium]
MRLLIVEDNRELCELMSSALESVALATDSAHSVESAKLMLQLSRYAAVILDLGLPDGDGLSVLRELRGRGNPTPVLILTARASVLERVIGLDAGADDYLGKPFAIEELIARIQALLRRPGAMLGKVLEAGNLVFDSVTRETTVAGKPINMPARELEILELLLRRQNRVVPKPVVESQLFGSEDPSGSNAIEVYVHRLRRRLETANAGVAIHTLRGIGYLLAPMDA